MKLGGIVAANINPNGVGIDWTAANEAVLLQPVAVRKNAANYFLTSLFAQAKRNITADRLDEIQIERNVRRNNVELVSMVSTGASTPAILQVMYRQRVA